MKAELVLAPREVQVLGLVADGLSDREVGRRLGISEETVATLLGRAMARMGVSCRAAAVGVAYREGFLVRRLVVVQVPRLSPETARVLSLVVAGRSNREIGLSLGIGEAAASSRVCWLLRAFGAVSRANLVKATIDAGLVSTDLRLRDVAREAVQAPKRSQAPLRAAQRAVAAVARKPSEIPSGRLLAAFLDALGSKRGEQIPADRLHALLLAGLADGLGRGTTFELLHITTFAGRRHFEHLSRDWAMRGDVALVVEGYRRGVIGREPADPVELTVSESNLLALIAAHGSYARVGEVAGRSADSVGDHAGKLFQRIGARNPAHAVKRGVDIGILALTPMPVSA